MLRTMLILAVSILVQFGCVPWGVGGLESDERAERSESGVPVIETTLWVSPSAAEFEIDQPVSLCAGSNPKDGAVLAGLKEGELSVVRVNGVTETVPVPLPKAVVPGTVHVHAAGSFVLVEATARRIDQLGGPFGNSEEDEDKYAFLYDEGLNLLWIDKVNARPDYPLRLDETGGVAIFEWTGIAFETRYNLPNGTTYNLGDVRVLGGPIARPDAETTLLAVELYATTNESATTHFAWLEVETGKVKIFHNSSYANWPSVEWHGMELGKRVLVAGDSLWGIARLCNTPILVSNPASLGENAVHMFVGDQVDKGGDLNSLVIVDQTRSGWSLFYHQEDKYMGRMSVHSGQNPTFERLDEPLPEGYMFFKPCEGMGFRIDPLGNVYAIGESDTHIQVFRILRNETQWQEVGESFTGAHDVSLEVGAAAIRIRSLSKGTCNGGAQNLAPSDDVALKVDHNTSFEQS